MDPTPAIQAVRRSGGFLRDSQFGLVCVEGPDAGQFLEAQLPLDIQALQLGGGHLSARLERRGRIQCLVVVIRRAAGFWLLTNKGSAVSLREDLKRFHIRENLTIHLAEDLDLWDVAGPELPSLIKDALAISADWNPYALSAGQWDGQHISVLSHPWTGDLAGHVIVPRVCAADVWEHLTKAGGNWVELDADQAALLLMEGGWPNADDLGERALIAEIAGGEAMVSFSKGCYLGQETVARVHSRGRVQRHLVGVLGDGRQPFASGALIVRDGITIGEITRSRWSPSLECVIGFAWIKGIQSEEGTVVHVSDQGNLRPATVCPLPFYKKPDAVEASARLRRQGMDAFQQDSFEAALGLFQKALVLNPFDLDAYEAMGVCYERMENLEEAVRVMEELRDMAPDHGMAWTNLSRYYAAQGKIQEAEEAKGKASYLGWKRAMGDAAAKEKAQAQAHADEAKTAERLELFRQVLDLDRDDVVANFGLGKLHVDRGEFAEAEPLLRRAIEIKREYSVAYNHLATCLIALGRKEEALDVLKLGVEVAGKQGDLMPKRSMERRLLELTL